MAKMVRRLRLPGKVPVVPKAPEVKILPIEFALLRGGNIVFRGGSMENGDYKDDLIVSSFVARDGDIFAIFDDGTTKPINDVHIPFEEVKGYVSNIQTILEALKTWADDIAEDDDIITTEDLQKKLGEWMGNGALALPANLPVTEDDEEEEAEEGGGDDYYGKYPRSGQTLDIEEELTRNLLYDLLDPLEEEELRKLSIDYSSLRIDRRNLYQWMERERPERAYKAEMKLAEERKLYEELKRKFEAADAKPATSRRKRGK